MELAAKQKVKKTGKALKNLSRINISPEKKSGKNMYKFLT